jgi:hypothetical protein
MRKFFLSIIIPAITLFSCNPEHPCENNQLNPTFIGYSISDIDTCFLKRYKVNDNFQNPIDSIIVTNKFPSIYTSSNDTTIVYINDSNPYNWISPGYDWKVYIPATNQTFSISEVKSIQTSSSAKTCYNPIESFKLDGIMINPLMNETGVFYTSGYRIYFRH